MPYKINRLALSLGSSLALLAGAQGSAKAAALTALPGFSVSVFASGTSTTTAPDSIIADGKFVYVGYGNNTASDGSDGLPTQIVQYSSTGKLQKTFSLPGHIDGLRANPTTKELYALLNQDGNPLLTTINPQTGKQHTFTLPALPGRGYDDLRFLNGQAFVSISNPVDSTSPVLGELVKSGSSFNVKPLLAAGTITDPDSLGISPNGDLLLDAQADQQLITIKNPGTANQSVSILPHPGVTFDDTIIAQDPLSTLLVTDTKNNAIYAIKGPFSAGTALASTTGDGSVNILNLLTGASTPLVSGLGSPHGLAFQSAAVPEPSNVGGTVVFGVVIAGCAIRKHKLQQRKSLSI